MSGLSGLAAALALAGGLLLAIGWWGLVVAVWERQVARAALAAGVAGAVATANAAGGRPPSGPPLDGRRLLRALAPLAATYLARHGPALDLGLRQAGNPWGLGSREWAGLQVLALGLVALATAPAALLGPAGACLFVLALAAAALGPALWLRGRAAARRAAIARAVPDLLDTLAACLQSGLTPDLALPALIPHLGGPLQAELEQAERKVTLHVPRPAAYQALATRLGVEALDLLAQAVAQASHLGVPVAATLHQQAAALRAQRLTAAREQAARAAPRITLVTTLLSAPVVFLFIVTMTLLGLVFGEGIGVQRLFE
jgi:tight adherence protein C